MQASCMCFSEMTVGETYCLVYASWFKAWQSYVKEEYDGES